MYTRNGEFQVDKNNFIVNAQGYRLTGYPANAIGANPVELHCPPRTWRQGHQHRHQRGRTPTPR